MNDTSLRVETGHHVLYGPGLSRRVDPLQDDQQGPPVLGVEPLLQVGQARSMLGDDPLSGLFAEAGGLGRIEMAKAKTLGLFHPEAPGEFHVIHACVLTAERNSAAQVRAAQLATPGTARATKFRENDNQGKIIGSAERRLVEGA